MLVKLSPYLIAILIGLLIGIERERQSIHGTKSMGVRTFLLLSILGAIAGGIDQPLIALALVIFLAAAVLINYMLSARQQSEKSSRPAGITTEIAALATFCLGYFSHIEPILCLLVGVTMVLILHNKTALHSFIRRYLRPDEIQAAAVLILLSVGVIPLIPNRTIDPLHIFNPFKLALLIAMIAGIQFIGYVISRIFGEKIGLPLAGFLAGNISSTAAFASYPRLARITPENYMSIASAALFAITAMLFQVFVLVAPISLPLLAALIIPLGIILLVCISVGIILVRKQKSDLARVTHSNPLNLRSAIKIGTLLTALIFIVDLSERFLGDFFTTLVSFFAALFELHGVVIGNANMVANKNVSIIAATNTIILAVTATMVSKIALTAFLAQGRYRKLMLVILGGLLLLTLGVVLLVKLVPAVSLKLIT
ncbi:MAG: DUF4010 domain-containing protein [Myxococcales bacterium]|nr:DUF4010 domain-containing protein [Myxococcales bacterium]USN49929.1 MAG: DUF4010 domain-containing protein [Myxococcales bacterium]